MTGSMGHRPPRRSSGVERIFEDDMGRLWSAGRTVTPEEGEALLFTCVTDAREPPRALSLPPDFHLVDADVPALRDMLLRAPRVGML